tara:strand:- start:797 stop:1213 length:417 start_codon:yes stop_codon:yes gene_type:complete
MKLPIPVGAHISFKLLPWQCRNGEPDTIHHGVVLAADFDQAFVDWPGDPHGRRRIDTRFIQGVKRGERHRTSPLAWEEYELWTQSPANYGGHCFAHLVSQAGVQAVGGLGQPMLIEPYCAVHHVWHGEDYWPGEGATA